MYNPLTKELSASEAYDSTRPIALHTPYAPESYDMAQQWKKCIESGNLMKVISCKKILKEMMAINYMVMTKGELLEKLIRSMDVGLFDPYRAKKKSAQIEGEKLETGKQKAK
jgi:hypothetical protein